MYEKCPDCGSEFIVVENENNELFYSCVNCDWYTVGENPFYVGAWNIEIRQALAPIDILVSLLNDKDVVKFLRPRLKGHSYLNNLKLPPSGLELSDEYLQGEVDIAYQVYLRQMVVLAASYVELILKDFYISWFTSKPLSMNQVLQPYDNKQAYISLKEIIESKSKKELIKHLVERAAQRKASNEPDKILEKLISDCKLDLDRPFVNDVRHLKEQRNRIVHEEPNDEIKVDQIYSYFGLLLYMLYILIKVAEYENIPYLDDVGFLRDFEERCATHSKL